MRSGILLRDDFDGEGLRRLARRRKDAAQTRRLLALASIYDGGSRSMPPASAMSRGRLFAIGLRPSSVGRHPISTALLGGVCAIWRNGFGKSFAFL